MLRKNAFLNSKTTLWIDVVLILLMVVLPSVLRTFLDVRYAHIKIIFTAIVCIGMIYKLVAFRTVLTKIKVFDVGVFVLFVYVLFHFSMLSETTIYDFKLWLYIAYFLMFYVFRWVIAKNNCHANKLLHLTLITLIVVSSFEACYGISQYFGWVAYNDEYYSLQGSFSSPNFFAAFLGYSVVALIWYARVFKKQLKHRVFTGTIILIVLCTAIVLSKSRGTWLALSMGLIVLIVTGKYFKYYLKTIKFYQVLIGVTAFLCVLVFSVNYLYKIKPDSVKGRLLVAKISTRAISKNPISGYGLFSFVGKYNLEKAAYFSESKRSWDEMAHANYIFTAFNDYLLVAFELGLVVLLVIIVLLIYVVCKAKITPITSLGLSFLIYIMVFAFFNTPSDNLYVMIAGVFGLAMVLNYGDFNSAFRLSVFAKKGIKSVAIVLGGLLVYAVCMKIINERKIRSLEALSSPESVSKFVKLFKITEDNRSTDAYLGITLYKKGFDSVGVTYLNRAYMHSANPEAGKLLARHYLNISNYKEAERICKQNINIEPYKYGPRMELLDLLKRGNRYGDIIALSQEVLDLPIKVNSQTIKHYKKEASNNLKRYSILYAKTKTKLKGSISNPRLVKSDLLKMSLPYKVYLPPYEKINKKLPVLYINDGYQYINSGNLPKLLDRLIVNDVIAPVVAVFLEPRAKSISRKVLRQKLYLCNANFADFFVEEFIPSIEDKYPVSREKSERAILGKSFGGLAAAYIADRSSNVFKNVIMQSPAFNPCPSIYQAYASAKDKDFKIYLSYGTGKDTEKQSLPMVQVLKRNDHQIKVDRVEGGVHDWSLWKPQLQDILIYFYGNKP